MTQFEYDNQNSLINQGLKKDIAELHNKYYAERNNLREKNERNWHIYHTERERLIAKLREIGAQRNELRRQGLQPFAIEMEKLQNEQVQIEDNLRVLKLQVSETEAAIKKVIFEKWQNLCEKVRYRKEQAQNESARLGQRYHNECEYAKNLTNVDSTFEKVNYENISMDKHEPITLIK